MHAHVAFACVLLVLFSGVFTNPITRTPIIVHTHTHAHTHDTGFLGRYGLALAALLRWDEAVQHYSTVASIVAQWPSEYRVMPERVLGASLAKILRDRDVAQHSNGRRLGNDGSDGNNTGSRHLEW